MGRIVDLCGEIAAAAEEGPDGLVLPPEDWERLSQDFSEDEIEDALDLVRESLFQSELVEAADSLSARLVEVLGAFGEAPAFAQAVSGGACISIEQVEQIARRVNRLEEVLEVFRDAQPLDKRGFEALQRRLIDQGIETEMQAEPPAPPEDEEESEDDD